MMVYKLNCGHSSKQPINVCSHVFKRKVTDGGVKHFTGPGIMAEYMCEKCAEQKVYSVHTVCNECIEEIEDLTYWEIKGKPNIKRDPQSFEFTRRSITLDIFTNVKILAFYPLKSRPSDALIFTSDGELYLVDILQSNHCQIASITSSDINLLGFIDLEVSNDMRFASITCHSQNYKIGNFNYGIVIDLSSGEILMRLNNGDYHTEHTDFPVTFIQHNNKTLVIHATDWKRLDITDPLTGQCLTEREYNNIPEAQKQNDTVFTEWDGQLLVSPDQRRIATIGWVWHPVGVAYSWDAQKWLDENIWEYESGESKKSYAIWDYFWHSPFLWLDNKRLCIWGYEQLHTEHDIPLDSVAIYDAETSKLLNWFAGPTMDIFYYDQYLFSGNEAGDGLTIWSVEEGALLHEEKELDVMAYHPGTKEFLSFRKKGVIDFLHWKKAD